MTDLFTPFTENLKMVRSKFSIVAACASAVILWTVVGAGQASAATITLDASANTGLLSFFPTLNTGDATAVAIGTPNPNTTRPLLAFDLSSIPSGAVVSSATLRLAFTGNNASTGTATIGAHKISASWVQGDGTAGSGATWSTRDGTTPWGTAGGDFNAVASASLTSLFIGSATSRVDYSFAGLAADVQSWIDNSATNFGWEMVNTVEATSPAVTKQMFLTDLGFDAVPKLDVTFEVPEPASLALIGVGGLMVLTRRRHA